LTIDYCTRCGNRTRMEIPTGDNLPRAVCGTCNHIHYENPRIIVGCIPEWENKILLCKRAIEPRLGFWTLPAGFMENNETTQEGALRETFEESLAKATIIEPFSLIDIPHINQVYLLYRAKLNDESYGTTAESSEVTLMNEQSIPWDQIAFKAIRRSLELYFEDARRNTFDFHVETIRISTHQRH